jgi:hypothetical protein
MCVVLCALPNVAEWVDLPAAIELRQTLQLNADGSLRTVELSEYTEHDDIEPAKLPRVMKRSAWIQAYFQRLIEEKRRSGCELDELAVEGHHPFQTIADAWRWLVALVGWRS